MKIKYPRTPFAKWRNRKLTREQIESIKRLYSKGFSYYYIAPLFKVSKTAIRWVVDPEYRIKFRAYSRERHKLRGGDYRSRRAQVRRGVYLYKKKIQHKELMQYNHALTIRWVHKYNKDHNESYWAISTRASRAGIPLKVLRAKYGINS